MQNKTHNKFFRLSMAFLLGTAFVMPSAFAKSQKIQEENIDVTNLQVTKDELAAIYVLSEVCPSLIKTDKQYETGYARLVKDYLPQEKSPETALKSLVKQSSYKQALDQARLDAKTAGDKGNTEVCQDVKEYNPKV